MAGNEKAIGPDYLRIKVNVQEPLESGFYLEGASETSIRYGFVMKDYPISATIVEEIKSYEHSLPPYEIKSDIPKQERKYGLHAYSPLMGDKDSAPAALSENSLEAQRQRYSSGQSPPLPKPPCSGLAPKAETLAGMSHPLGPDTLLAGRQKAITSSTTQARAH